MRARFLTNGFLARAALGISFLVGLPAHPSSAPQAQCDRACLNALVDQYLAAMVAHDPSQLPLAKNVKFTEDGVPLKLGDGLWATASGLGTYKLYFAEPEAGGAGVLCALAAAVSVGATFLELLEAGPDGFAEEVFEFDRGAGA